MECTCTDFSCILCDHKLCWVMKKDGQWPVYTVHKARQTVSVSSLLHWRANHNKLTQSDPPTTGRMKQPVFHGLILCQRHSQSWEWPWTPWTVVCHQPMYQVRLQIIVIIWWMLHCRLGLFNITIKKSFLSAVWNSFSTVEGFPLLEFMIHQSSSSENLLRNSIILFTGICIKVP